MSDRYPISSFPHNTVGGYIIYGLEEDGDVRARYLKKGVMPPVCAEDPVEWLWWSTLPPLCEDEAEIRRAVMQARAESCWPDEWMSKPIEAKARGRAMNSTWCRTPDLADMSREDMEFWRDRIKEDPDLFKEETPQARAKPKSSYQRRGLAPRCPVCMRDGCSGHVEPPPPPPCQCPVCMGESRPLPGMPPEHLPTSDRTPWYESPYATFPEPFYDDYP